MAGCANKCTEPCACAVMVLLQRFSSTSPTTTAGVELHQRHDRVRLHVSPDSTITAGTVFLDVGLEDPDSQGTFLWAQLGSVAYNAQGGSDVFTVGPIKGHQVRARVIGLAGTGNLVALFESWQEAK